MTEPVIVNTFGSAEGGGGGGEGGQHGRMKLEESIRKADVQIGHQFTERVIKHWDSLPGAVVMAPRQLMLGKCLDSTFRYAV